MDGYFSSLAAVEVFGEPLKFTTIDLYYAVSEDPQAQGPKAQWPTASSRLLNPTWGDMEYADGFFSCCFDGNDIVRFIDYNEGMFSVAGECSDAARTLCLSINCYANPSLPRVQSSGFEDSRSDLSSPESLTVLFMDARDVTASSLMGECHRSEHSTRSETRESNIENSDVSSLGAACELLLFILDNTAADEISVVGLDAFFSAPDYSLYQHTVLSSLAKELGWHCEGLLKFRTHDVYREMVGEERYRLLTVR